MNEWGSFSRDLQLGGAMASLARELGLMGVRSAELHAECSERDLRLDGQLRADARPKGPLIAVVFAHPATGRETVIRCAKFDKAKKNVRAIALTVDGLRRMERYGTAPGSAEGFFSAFAALPPAASESGGEMTVDDALAFIGGGLTRSSSAESFKSACREAAKRCHSDGSGSNNKFIEFKRARDLLTPLFGDKP